MKKNCGCLLLKGSLHSFITEIARFTKTSGFHYAVSNNKILHHNGKWEVSYNSFFNYVLVKGNDGQEMQVYPKCFYVNGKLCEVLKTPEGASYHPEEVWTLVLEAVAKYAVAQFFCLQYADHIHKLLQSTG